MKKLLLLPFLWFPLVSSQELSEAFLNTLPANIRADFEQSSQEDPTKNFVSPDTRIKKLESSLQEAQVLLSKIQADLSDDESIELERFGLSIFNSIQSSFLPINFPNPALGYILDVGDVLEIQLVGGKKGSSESIISRNGQILIKEVGPISVSGLTLQDAAKLIKEKVSSSLVGVEAFVSLAELRDINVLIVGLTPNPGMYTLSGGSTPLSLLFAAGGITEEGSFRQILHKRDSEIIQVIDLYDTFINGNLTFKHQLRSGDVLVVEPKFSEVRVFGNFATPAIYEFKPNENLSDILSFARIKPNNSNLSLSVKRFENGARVVKDVTMEDAKFFTLNHADSISLTGINPQFKGTQKVFLTGEVHVPGEYIIQEHTTLSELIEMAGGYTDYAYPEMGNLRRLSAKNIELVARDKTYDEIIRYIVASPNFSQILTGPDSNGIITFLSLLKDYKPSGRVVTDFNLQNIKQNLHFDRVLEDRDEIHIPNFKPEIYILGEVINPGSYSYQANLSLLDYLQQSGGFTRIADEGRAIIILPNGQSAVYESSAFNLFSKNTPEIIPGTTIYIPTRVNKLDGLNFAATAAPIFSSVALSLASLNSINN